MQEEFIIDGTSILKENRSFSPLLQLLLILKNKKNNFYCYFDGNTRYQFEKDVDKQLYQNLIKFGLEEYFIQVSNLDSDVPLLEQADKIGARIISNDNYENYRSEYNWLVHRKAERLIDIHIVEERLVIKQLDIDENIQNDTTILMSNLVQLLEKEGGRLEGKIDKYKKDREFGFIKRNGIGRNIFFSKNSITDEKLDVTQLGTEVSFDIGVGQSGNIYYFAATNIQIKKAASDKKNLEVLSGENKILKETKDELQAQNAKARAELETRIQALRNSNEQLEKDKEVLAKELETYKGTKDQIIRRLESLKEALKSEILVFKQKIAHKDEEINELKNQLIGLREELDKIIVSKKAKDAESNELAVVVDVQSEKIRDLDEDLKNTLQMFEFQDLDEASSLQFEQLKKDYSVAVNSLRSKNAKIIFLTNNINDLRKQLTLNTEEVIGNIQPTNMDELLTRIQELERANTELSKQVNTISKTSPKPRKTSRRPKAQVSDEEENHSDSEYSSAPSSSRPSYYKEVEEPKIEEIPYDELKNWWYNLNDDWQKAFNQGVLSRGEILQIPSEEQMRSIFEKQKIDIVGSGILLYGLNQLSFKLKDFSGLKDLKQITELNLSGHEFTDLEGVQELQKLELLNCTSNRIASLTYIKKLENLKTLIIRDNDLVNLDGIDELEELEYLNALYNQKLRTIGGVEDLENLQVLCVPNYKTRIIKQLAKLEKVNPNVEVRNV